jgi:hypothetical protein
VVRQGSRDHQDKWVNRVFKALKDLREIRVPVVLLVHLEPLVHQDFLDQLVCKELSASLVIQDL